MKTYTFKETRVIEYTYEIQAEDSDEAKAQIETMNPEDATTHRTIDIEFPELLKVEDNEEITI